MDVKIEKIIRSKRKTVALQVTNDATLIIRAPYNVSDETIMLIISKHEDWIKRKKIEIEARGSKFTPKEFVNGEGFLYLGQSYKLTIVDEQDIPLRFDNGFYLSRNALSRAREVFIEWYKKETYKKVLERVEKYAKEGGFEYGKINITNANKRWGSCSQNGNLNFSWRLVMAPLSVIDYVVVHELVHTEEKNHSKNFWLKIKILLPNFEKQLDWLKVNEHLLTL
ncbi:MAG: SprT family zinc-dependent metalloprotease [candidate division WOR-3 bacterium]